MKLAKSYNSMAPLHHNKQLQVSLEWTELFPLFFLAQVIQRCQCGPHTDKSWQVRLPFLFSGTKLLAISEFSTLPISRNLSFSQCHVCSIILKLPPWNRPTSDQLNSHLNQIWRHIRFFHTKAIRIISRQVFRGWMWLQLQPRSLPLNLEDFDGCSKITVIWDGYGPTSKSPNPNKRKVTAWS